VIGAWVRRAARVAFAFVVMNSSAIEGLFALRRGRKLWDRQLESRVASDGR
jgi:hypothetical protein